MSLVQLTAFQRRRLRDQLNRAREASYYRRLVALLELDRGRCVAEVAQTLGVTRQSVYHWAYAFGACPAAAALRDQYGGGRSTLRTEKLEALLSGLG